MSTRCMEYFKKDEDVVRKVRIAFGVDEEEVRKDIEVLKEWVKKQPHLPGDDSKGSMPHSVHTVCNIHRATTMRRVLEAAGVAAAIISKNE